MVTNISTKVLSIYTFHRSEYNRLEVDLFHVENCCVKLSVRPIFKRWDGVTTNWGVATVITVLNDAPVWDEKFKDFKPDPEKEKELIDAVLKELHAELNN